MFVSSGGSGKVSTSAVGQSGRIRGDGCGRAEGGRIEIVPASRSRALGGGDDKHPDAFQIESFAARRSRVLAVWWAALHLLLCGSVLAATGSVVAGAVALGVLAVHAAVRFPDTRVVLARSGDGRWSIPAQGLFDLELGTGTSFAASWVLLQLVSRDRSLRLVLLRDQLGVGDWRRLQVAVRESAFRAPTE